MSRASRHSRAVDAAIPEEDREEFIRLNPLYVVRQKDALIARLRNEIRLLLSAKKNLRQELEKARQRG